MNKADQQLQTQIHNKLIQMPDGATEAALMGRCSFARNYAHFHGTLVAMESAGSVVSRDIEGTELWFSAAGKSSPAPAGSKTSTAATEEITSKPRGRILEHLRVRPSSLEELAKHLKMNEPAVYYHIQRMMKDHIIEATEKRKGQQLIYSPAAGKSPSAETAQASAPPLLSIKDVINKHARSEPEPVAALTAGKPSPIDESPQRSSFLVAPTKVTIYPGNKSKSAIHIEVCRSDDESCAVIYQQDAFAGRKDAIALSLAEIDAVMNAARDLLAKNAAALAVVNG